MIFMMVPLIFTVITCIICFLIVFTFTGVPKKRITLKDANNNDRTLTLPPGPIPWPIIGNIPEMLLHKPTFRWILKQMKEMNTEICCIRLGNTHVIPVTCPHIACEILKKKDAIFASRPLSHAARVQSGGYLTTVVVPLNDQWKKMRRLLISEIITPARLKWLQEKRTEEADNLVFYILNSHKKNNPLDLRFTARHYCANVIRKMVFGKRYFGKGMLDGGPGPEEIEHVNAMLTSLNFIYSFCVSDYLHFLEGFNLDKQEKIVNDANTEMRKHWSAIVDERIELWRIGERNDVTDLLDVFISLTDGDNNTMLTAEEIKNQVIEVMMASIDNPSNIAEWALAEMLNQPTLLEKARQEIEAVVGKDRLVQESDIRKLNFIKACARETFRLHPVAPFNVPHVSTEDTVIAGYFIPKGSHALLSRYGLGRNPKIWENPLKFDPERHLVKDHEVVLTEHDLRFISFSTGRRGCIASSLGTSMTIMLLGRLIQCFDWAQQGNDTTVDLLEGVNDLLPASPVTVMAKPRLAPHLYPTTS